MVRSSSTSGLLFLGEEGMGNSCLKQTHSVTMLTSTSAVKMASLRAWSAISCPDAMPIFPRACPFVSSLP
ncbi:hypothetical protein RHECNPAF_1260086 [Rhizobium etli CNPAF512]|nr:hypothetical protein RHECNPAF_1260086 [Rhizobium etli CNPAF512]